MPNETQYAVSVSATVEDDTGAKVAIHSPTFYLHPDVQGIVDEAHATRIINEWFGRLGLEYTVAVAATTVDTPDPQANALLRAVKRSQSNAALVMVEPFDLPDGYLLVRESNVGQGVHAFECGIAPDGRVSS